jgi:predicted metal-binding protein
MDILIMEKILIVGCKRAMDDVCIGCSRCMVAFNRKVGEFESYKGKEVELIGLLNCGDCPGAAIVPRLVQINLWNKPMNEDITKVHVAPCIIDHCPYKEVLIEKIKSKAGVEVVLGTHPFIPESIFS